ncbi:hypothetical protein Aduo_001780 [Ancylostoma duodenale]
MSVIWSLYKKNEGRIWWRPGSFCKICAKIVKIPRSKTTTNMHWHLRESHKEEMKDAETTPLKENIIVDIQSKLDELCKRKTSSSTIEEAGSKDEANRVVCKQEGYNIAVTVDSWSSSNANCSLLAITGHVTGGEIEDRRNIWISCIPFQAVSYTAGVLEAKFREGMKRLGISPEQISCMLQTELQ